MKKSHILLAAWGVTVAIVLAMPQLRSLVRFSFNSLVSPNERYGRMAMSPDVADTQEDKFVAAIHASHQSVTTFSVSPHSNLTALRNYCVAFPNDLEAAGIYCRRAMRQPYQDPGKPKQTSKAWIERSKAERNELMEIASAAEKQDPKNWLFRLAKAYVYLHDSNSTALASTLTAQPLPSMYTDYARGEAERLDAYYKGTFWGITPVQTVATHASIVFPNYAAISGLFDPKYRSIPQPEKLVGAKCAIDIASSSEFFIGSLVAKNIAVRLVGPTVRPKRRLETAELEAQLSKADWIRLMPHSEQQTFGKLVVTQPKFEFDDDLSAMMAATSTHLPLMMGLVVVALAAISLIPWRPNLKYPYAAPVAIALASLPLSFNLGTHGAAVWAENNSFTSMFVDFSSAQMFIAKVAYGVIGVALIFAAYRLISTWSDRDMRRLNVVALLILIVSLFPTPIQFFMVLLGSLLVTLDSEKRIQPGVAVFLCVVGMGFEYSFHPLVTHLPLGAVPAFLAVVASTRIRGVMQLGWLGLALVFSSFLMQRITLPSLGTWYEKEKEQLAEYRSKIGVESKTPLS